LRSYGADQVDLYRRAAYFVDKILKGKKPAGLPVQQPTEFELVVNLKTAQTLGLTIPRLIQARRRGHRVRRRGELIILRGGATLLSALCRRRVFPCWAA
jgi:ABC-type uncharacterized transport system substrate-binding protein